MARASSAVILADHHGGTKAAAFHRVGKRASHRCLRRMRRPRLTRARSSG